MEIAQVVVYVQQAKLCANQTCWPVVLNSKTTKPGTYSISRIIYDPVFVCLHDFCRGAPPNTMGTRIIDLEGTTMGVHGFYRPLKFGAEESIRCIRLNNADIENLISNYLFNQIIIKP